LFAELSLVKAWNALGDGDQRPAGKLHAGYIEAGAVDAHLVVDLRVE
jgi:hypothetical protein